MQAASVFKTGPPAVLGHVPSVLIEGQTRDHVGGLQREGGGIDAQVFWRRVLQQHGVRAAEAVGGGRGGVHRLRAAFGPPHRGLVVDVPREAEVCVGALGRHQINTDKQAGFIRGQVPLRSDRIDREGRLERSLPEDASARDAEHITGRRAFSAP